MCLALIEQLKTWHGQPSIIETYQERQSPAELIAVGSNTSLFPCRFFFSPLPTPISASATHTHTHTPLTSTHCIPPLQMPGLGGFNVKWLDLLYCRRGKQNNARVLRRQLEMSERHRGRGRSGRCGGKKISSQTLNQFEKKLGCNPTCLSEEAIKVRKKKRKHQVSSKREVYIYIYFRKTI